MGKRNSFQIQPRLVIFSYKFGESSRRFFKEAQVLGWDAIFLLYEDLLLKALPIPQIPVNAQTFLRVQYPQISSDIMQTNYHSILQIVLNEYQFKGVLDEQMYRKSYMHYEDKLFQKYVFNKLHISSAKLVAPPFSQDQFPLMAKKRLSSRGKGNTILFSQKDFEEFQEGISSKTQYIYEQYIPLRNDYRVLILYENVLAVVKREVVLKKGGRCVVRVQGSAKLPVHIIQMCFRIKKEIGCDFCGIDVGEKEDGSFFIIESNISPNFTGVERETGLNVARTVLIKLFSHAL